MRKYLAVFKISLEDEFVYKLNFVMWRVRNVFQILLTFFLWSTIYSNPQTILFGYDRTKILTYVFGIMIVRAFVMSARTMDIAGEIAKGDISNYLVRPLSYFKYWFSRDISSKVLNLGFAAFEFGILFLILKPNFFLQTNFFTLIAFIIAILLAIFIYFFTLILVSSISFWMPELNWGGHFLITVVIVESLSGSLFPINILPSTLHSIVMSLPFPYLVYFPVQVYLGNITGLALLGGMMIALAWVGILYFLTGVVWQRGLRVYESIGR